MKITIEIGNATQKSNIENELKLIQKFIEAYEPPLNINQIIVPIDFDSKINDLEKTSNYKSMRGVIAVAKIVKIENGNAIVLSPYIYTKNWDIQTRLFTYIHEAYHVANNSRVLKPVIQSPSKLLYFNIMYRIFDEYLADRQAFEFLDKIFPIKSHLMQNHLDSHIAGFIRVINDRKYYKIFVEEIASFRVHANIQFLLERTHTSLNEITESIAHLFSRIDNYPKYLDKSSEISCSSFINDKAYALIHFFRKQYTEKYPNLIDGLNYITDFMLNFGMIFEDTSKGVYCHVLDI